VIPRYQTILFVVLLAVSATMGVFLWQMRYRSYQRLLNSQDSAPTQAPQVAPAQQVTLYVASDADNALLAQPLSLPLPNSPGPRARAILGRLLDLYTVPNSPHPVPGGAAAIAQVFLLPVDDATTASTSTAASKDSRPQLAVVNLTRAFAAAHPSGLETETLTVLSICATLHANLPGVTQVRFLVDGAPRATLAGHADLARTYLAGDAAPTEGLHP
jgi:hypothetical protein